MMCLLERVNSTKFLGDIIDENLAWKHHVDTISKTIFELGTFVRK